MFGLHFSIASCSGFLSLTWLVLRLEPSAMRIHPWSNRHQALLELVKKSKVPWLAVNRRCQALLVFAGVLSVVVFCPWPSLCVPSDRDSIGWWCPAAFKCVTLGLWRSLHQMWTSGQQWRQDDEWTYHQELKLQGVWWCNTYLLLLSDLPSLIITAMMFSRVGWTSVGGLRRPKFFLTIPCLRTRWTGPRTSSNDSRLDRIKLYMVEMYDCLTHSNPYSSYCVILSYSHRIGGPVGVSTCLTRFENWSWLVCPSSAVQSAPFFETCNLQKSVCP